MGEDRRGEWETGVDKTLAMLASAQRSTDQELNDQDLRGEDHDKTLHGDSATSGLIGRVETIEHLTARLESCVFSSPGNKNGLDKRVDALEDGTQASSFKWNVATAVTVAMIGVLGTTIGLLGLLIMNWDKVDAMVYHYRHPQELREGKRRGKTRQVLTPEEQGQTWR